MKKCLIVVNTSKEKSTALSKVISAFLLEKGISVSVFNFDGFSDENPATGSDFVITLGGDGTVLFAARNCAALGIPVFPINLGEFGFIAGVQPSSWKESLEAFLEGRAPVTERTLVQAKLFREQNEIANVIGLNDIVVAAKHAAKTITLDVAYNNVQFCHLKGDGVILSTPTGSTAYSTSAGGPIIDPELDALLFTPINPFSLSSRPLVLNPNGEVSITVQEGRTKSLILSADGQTPVAVTTGDVVLIKRWDYKVRLVWCTADNFYTALCSKMNWSGGPHA